MKEKNRLYGFCNDLITVFTNYVNILDSYFSVPGNQQIHEFLYAEYKELGKELRKLEEKYKKWIF